jgi:hypothetical protein
VENSPAVYGSGVEQQVGVKGMNSSLATHSSPSFPVLSEVCNLLIKMPPHKYVTQQKLIHPLAPVVEKFLSRRKIIQGADDKLGQFLSQDI